MKILWILVLSFSLLSTPLTRGEEVILVDGRTFGGTLREIHDEQIEFSTSEQTHTVAHQDLLRVGQFVGPRQYPRITLRDGSLLVAHDVLKPDGTIQLARDEMVITASSWQPPKVRRGAAATILFRAVPASFLDAVESDNLDSILVDTDRIEGHVIAIQDGELRIRVRNDAGDDTIDVPLARVAAIQFATGKAADVPPAKIRYLVGLRDGTTLAAASIQLDLVRAMISLASGGEFTVPHGFITAVQVYDGRARYLSEFEPLAYRHTPYLSGNWPLGIDRNAKLGQLHAGGSPFHRGIGMHSQSRVVFRLDGKYRRLLATLAVDDMAHGFGSVTFRVLAGDGVGNWQSAYQSPTVRGGGDGIPLDIDISAAKFVALVVDYADRADQRDLANWLDARVLP